MARIKLKLGENEIEIDSRDFYVDNYSVGEVIDNMAKYMPKVKTRIVYDDAQPEPLSTTAYSQNIDYLRTLNDAEVHEPEFTEPVPIHESEIKDKLKILAQTSFFDDPRTVSEAVSQLREYGWIASPLDVSKALAKMAFNKEILKNSQENICYYFVKEALLTN